VGRGLGKKIEQKSQQHHPEQAHRKRVLRAHRITEETVIFPVYDVQGWGGAEKRWDSEG